MEKQMFPDMAPEARKAAMEAGCYKKTQKTFMRPFSEEELEAHKEKLTENSIKLGDLEAKKKEVTKQFDADIKPVKLDVRTSVKALRDKAEEIQGDVYLFDNQEEGTMETYDANGNFIESRRLFPDEKQTKIKSLVAANG